MKESDPLKKALKQSFVAKTKPAKAVVAEPNKPVKKTTNLPQKQIKIEKAVAKNVYLFSKDLEAIDEILTVLQDCTGVRGRLSDAVKIALRACNKSPNIVVNAYQDLRKEDGRSARHKK